MATITNTIRKRLRLAVRDAIRAIALTGFNSDNVVSRKTPLGQGLGSPAIVVSGGRISRRPSPAGLRVRQFIFLATVYLINDGSGEPDQDDQDNILETIEAVFDLPPTMPAAITSAVVEAQECRVDRGQQYMSDAFRYGVDKHSVAIMVEVSQVAGVAS